MLDLGSPGLSPALAVPFALVENAFRRLTNLVQDMPQTELAYTGPAGGINSTASLVWHIARADVQYLHLIMDVPLSDELTSEFGPFEDEQGRIPAIAGKSAEQILAHQHRVVEMAREYLRSQTDADALREVRVPWWPQTATVRYVLWHMASHSMFHQGQIRRLREWYKANA